MIEQRLGHAGLDQSRADGVDTHARADQRISGRLHETDHRRLARAIGHVAGIGAHAADGRRGDDRTGALPDHDRRGMLDRQKHADHIHAQDFRKILNGDIEQRRHATSNAGIGVDNVEPAEFLRRRRDEFLDVGLIAGVHRQATRRMAGLLDHFERLFEALFGAIRDQQPRAFLGETQRGRAADAASRPRHDRRFSRNPSRHLFLRFSRRIARHRIG